MPQNVPVQYLFRPEHNKLVASLDLTRPFTQKIKVGKSRDEKIIDLMESWLYLQGYWTKSRRSFDESGKKYLAIETTNGVLIIFREIETGEDDTAPINTIIDQYKGDGGEPSVARIELNHDADIRKIKLPVTPEVLVYRFIAAFLGHSAFGKDSWECRNGYFDSSGMEEYGINPAFDLFPYAKERIRVSLSSDFLQTPAYRFWFIKKNGKPVICLETTGAAWISEGQSFDINELYKKEKRIWPVVWSVAGHFLP